MGHAETRPPTQWPNSRWPVCLRERSCTGRPGRVPPRGLRCSTQSARSLRGSTGWRSGAAHDQLVRQQHVWLQRLSRRNTVLDDAEQQVCRLLAKLSDWLTDSRQGWIGERRERNVVEADDRHVVWNPSATGTRSLQRTECHEIVQHENGRELGGVLEQLLSR